MAGAHTHAHAKRDPDSDQGSGRSWMVAIFITAVMVAVAAVAVVIVRNHDSHGTADSGHPSAALAADTAPAPAVVSVTPADNATGVPTDATISVQLSAPLSPSSPTPSLSPAVAGSWQLLTPDTFTFVATAPLVPLSTETVTVPGGDHGVTGASGKTMKDTVTSTFTVADGSVLRLQQLLGELDYLPVSFTPAGPLTAPQEAAQAQEGTFNWRASEPASLVSQWTAGTSNVITKGAVMNFENQNDLKTDGVAGPAVWSKLLAAAAAGTVNTQPYTYVYVVNAASNETATVYSNGAEVLSTPANTGVPAASTEPGTFPVYARYTVTTMSGTNPDGSKYVDPGIKWVSYFNGGDALHAFPRSSYGTPQSVGCVEMPEQAAAAVFPLTPIGTLVTVS